MPDSTRTNTIFAVSLAAICAVPLVLISLNRADAGPANAGSVEPIDAAVPAPQTGQPISIRVFNERGELTDAIDSNRIERTEEQWRDVLTDEEFDILREHGTERAGTSELLSNSVRGVYVCAGCGLPLFHSDTKYDSGTGWPSFYEPISELNVGSKIDNSLGMRRLEVHCNRCGGHLGHVFPDGPDPTGLRYCINGDALDFIPQEDLAKHAEVSEAVLAGGCFWCVEAVFEEVDGVIDVVSGYAGGDGPTSYAQVITGRTGHAEAVRITYDPAKVSYTQLLEIHFATHNPTTLNRQGADVGTHYRSAIFYTSDEQKTAAKTLIEELDESDRFIDPIVTTLESLEAFHTAEEYHQDFAERNPKHRYITNVSNPKVKKLREAFPERLKTDPTDRDTDTAEN